MYFDICICINQCTTTVSTTIVMLKDVLYRKRLAFVMFLNDLFLFQISSCEEDIDISGKKSRQYEESLERVSIHIIIYIYVFANIFLKK